jgi:predicted dehydrogenase
MKTYSAAFIGCGHMTEPVVDDALDEYTIIRPYRHGETLRACDRLRIVACSSGRAGARQWVGERNGIPPERQYADYRELIDRERPELVVIGTQPEQRAERAIYAAEHGVKAIYAEKAMAASMQEVDAMVDAVERNGVFFNLGSQRRWDPAYDKIKEVIDSGELGALKSLISHYAGLLFGHASHYFDLILRLNSDAPVA